ncbi:hypothetical protein ACW5R3_05330 [Bizionia sp. KMM 8389]
MQRFGAILLFYKPYILWSIGLVLLLMSLSYNLAIICIAKLFIVGFLWYFLTETTAKRKLIFYKNLGISNLKLFFTTYVIDISITYLVYQLIDVFV